jgi:4-hydroxy-4-methyl-2-oxoglutarate aldolase
MSTNKEKESVRRRFLEVDTANVSDILDGKGRAAQGLSAGFASRSGTKLAGWAFTIAGEMAPGNAPTDAEKIAACQDVGAGDVAVWSGNGDGVCYFGELIAIGMQQKGCVGALVDGGIRDIRWLEAAGFPVFATYRTPVQSIGRWRVTQWQAPVYLPGATSRHVVVHPGDFVLADEDGAIVIPAELVNEVLVEAEEVTRREARLREVLRAGTPLQDAIDRFGPI